MPDSTRSARTYLVRGEETALIDSGLPGAGRALVAELRQAGVAHLDHLLITHFDVDHIGNARLLEEELGAVVWLPRDDAPYVMGQRARPGLKWLIGAIMRVPPPRSPRLIAPGDRTGGLMAVASPGHTPGHTAYRGDGFLCSGDAIQRWADGRAGAGPSIMAADPGRARASATELTRGFAGWLLPAHFDPVLIGGS